MRQFLIILFIITGNFVFGQHYPLLDQYVMNRLAVNPANTGNKEALCVFASYRNQWTGIKGTPVTQTFSADAPLKNEHIALGFMIFNDKHGVTKQNGIYTLYAWRIRLKQGNLSFGLKAGINLYQSRWSDVKITQPNDHAFLFDTEKKAFFDYGLGLNFSDTRFDAGLSIPVLKNYSNQYDYLSETENQKKAAGKSLLIYTGFRFPLTSQFTINPSALLLYHSQGAFQADISCLAVYREILESGISCKSKDALVLLFNYKINPNLKVGYSCGSVFSSFNSGHYGSHEVFIQYVFGYMIQGSNPRYFYQ